MVDCPFHPKVLQTDYIFESCAIIKRVIKEYKTSKEEAKSKKRTLNLESVSLSAKIQGPQVVYMLQSFL